MLFKNYCKKPVEVKAVKLTNLNIWKISEEIGENVSLNLETDAGWTAGAKVPPIYSLTIHTLEGDMKAQYGDYIIQGVNGEFYPCKPDIFEKTYEAVL